MAAISAVIITYNEERNIARCLSSLEGVADEIVVVDSFSADRTAGIAKEFNARVITHAFEGYIEQKNYACGQATHDYVLSLDADEALDEVLKQSILRIKDHPQATAYAFNRLTSYCGKWIYHCGWYPDRKLRLFDRRACRWGGVNPHDKLEFTGGHGKTVHLEGNILHYSYYTVAEHHAQTDRFTTIAARALYEKGVRPGIVKLYLSPVAKFLKDYFINLGFLDGYYGFTICRISARATYMKYTKLKRLYLAGQ
jgi:glycosyltransferase involved in cell wall biosynthesis